MADQTQAQYTDPVQPEPMPSSNQVPSVDYSSGTNAPQEVSVPESDDLSLPDNASSRTAAQFEKLREDLREERRRREQLEQAYTYQTKPAVDNTPMYDPNTGYVDITKLEQTRYAAIEAQTRATNAEQKFERYVQEKQEEEAFAAHPELNPNAKNHDKELHKMTRALIMDSMVNPNDYDGRELTARQAADLAKKQRSKVVEQIKAETTTQVLEQLSPKEQASFEATGRSDKRVDAQDFSDLVDRTRRNDLDAIMARMKNIPVAGR